MATFIAKVSGMSCSSCEVIIRKVLESNSAKAVSVDANKGEVVFELGTGEPSGIKDELGRKGYTVTELREGVVLEKTEQKIIQQQNDSFLDYASKSLDGTVETEHRIILYSLAGFALLLGLFMLLGPVAFGMENLNMLPLVILAAASSVVAVGANEIVMLYDKRMSCQNSMMAGMTMGMATGFMFGGIIGATNGMFIGSVAGIALGSYYGIKAGNCHGAMGIMEGIMAGFMGGTMGAMLSVMMINDNLLQFLAIMFIMAFSVVAGLAHVLHKEEGWKRNSLKTGLFLFMIKAGLLFYGLIAAMALLPANGLTYRAI